MHSYRLLIAAASTAFGLATASAQVWTRDANFAPALHNDIPALNQTTFVPSSDGRVMVWGNFTHLSNGAFASRGIGFLRADGTPDPSFISGLSAGDTVYAAAPLTNGMALAILFHNGTTSIVRLLANGQIDPKYATVATVTPVTLTSLPDGRVLVWADYLRLDSTVRTFLARFDADGTLDPSFKVALPATIAGVAAVAGAAGGKIYVSTVSQSNTAAPSLPGTSKLLRLNADGSVDGVFVVPDISNAFTMLAVQPDGKLLAATSKTLMRFTPDGTIDSTFTSAIANLQKIERVLVRPDGQVVLQAQVGTGSPLPSTVLVLSSSGSVQRDLGATFLSGDTVQIAAVENDDTLLVVHGLPQAVNEYQPMGPIATGSNSTTTTTPFSSGSTIIGDPGPIWPIPAPSVVPARPLLARITADATGITSADAGPMQRGAVYIGQAFIDTSGQFVVTGQFTDANGQPRTGIARFTTSGALDPSYSPAFGDATLGAVLAFAPDGAAIATESLLGPRGSDGLYRSTSRIIRISASGSADPSFNAPTGTGLKWHAIAADGRILVSYFSPDNSSESNLRLVWLNSDGTVASTLPTQFSGLRSPIAVIPDFAVSIGNATTGIGVGPTVPAPTLPTVLPSYANQISFARPLADGHIVIGGAFTGINGRSVPGLARLNADGSVDSSYKPDLS